MPILTLVVGLETQLIAELEARKYRRATYTLLYPISILKIIVNKLRLRKHRSICYYYLEIGKDKCFCSIADTQNSQISDLKSNNPEESITFYPGKLKQQL